MPFTSILHDTFGFTRNELRIVALLSIVMTAGLGIRWYRGAHPVPPDMSPPFAYAALDSTFLALSNPADSVASRDTQPPRAPREPIDINAAGASDLIALPGIGPATAARIIEDRRARGPFQRVDDLLRVKGIGPKKLARIRPHVRVGPRVLP
jgi:competence protein ComEA